jgi:hypothetical protein
MAYEIHQICLERRAQRYKGVTGVHSCRRIAGGEALAEASRHQREVARWCGNHGIVSENMGRCGILDGNTELDDSSMMKMQGREGW